MENSKIIKFSLDFVQSGISYHLEPTFDTDDLNKGHGSMVEDINFIDTNGDIYIFLIRVFLVIHSASRDLLEYTLQDAKNISVWKTNYEPIPCAGQ
jgi:hypothetical protein